ncbi:uncharacterized protein LOC118223962 isoform X1 [Anguilla anguilla]|uniref:uncharacterized protein LOC118223962 isoform X1 n=1 Tax=Anguilla anguilla TaxID=7936 RepID=UPI0015ADCF4A|nr:uncharacterized protein LOC118223962 isoform X1 [Anguilla anguilla]
MGLPLPPGVLLLGALWSACPGQAAVVPDFNHVERCKEALYMGTPPRGYFAAKLKKICQRYADRPRYATLYDPRGHIPVYSAYTFKKSDGEKHVDFPWMFEPQLGSEKGGSNMEPFPQTHMHMNFEDTQAVLEDYSDVVQYERGHLNPDEHQADPLDKAATYTLTNVVPQIREFNTGPWSDHEDQVNGSQEAQQLLPGDGVRGDRHDLLRQHDPAGQRGPRGHPRVHVDRLLLRGLRPQRPLRRALQAARLRRLRPEQPRQQPRGGGAREEPGEVPQGPDGGGHQLPDLLQRLRPRFLIFFFFALRQKLSSPQFYIFGGFMCVAWQMATASLHFGLCLIDNLAIFIYLRVIFNYLH